MIMKKNTNQDAYCAPNCQAVDLSVTRGFLQGSNFRPESMEYYDDCGDDSTNWF